MENFMNELMSQYLVPIIGAALTALFGYIGVAVKNCYKRYADTKVKREIVDIAVKATQQMFYALSGPEKLEKCIDMVSEELAKKKVEISDLELRMMIESAVAEFKKQVKEEEVSLDPGEEDAPETPIE